MDEQRYPEPTVGALIFNFIFFDFACRTDSTDVRLNEEAQEYMWVTLEDARRLPVEHYTAVAIGEYLKKKGAYC